MQDMTGWTDRQPHSHSSSTEVAMTSCSPKGGVQAHVISPPVVD